MYIYKALFSAPGPSLVGNPKRKLLGGPGVGRLTSGVKSEMCRTLLASMVHGVLKHTPETQCGSKEVSLGSKEQLKNGCGLSGEN